MGMRGSTGTDGNSIDDCFQGLDRFSKRLKNTTKLMYYAAGIGFVVGVAGGIWFGETLNDCLEFLRQSPKVVQYAVDGGLALIWGGVGAGFGYGGAILGEGLYKNI